MEVGDGGGFDADAARDGDGDAESIRDDGSDADLACGGGGGSDATCGGDRGSDAVCGGGGDSVSVSCGGGLTDAARGGGGHADAARGGGGHAVAALGGDGSADVAPGGESCADAPRGGDGCAVAVRDGVGGADVSCNGGVDATRMISFSSTFSIELPRQHVLRHHLWIKSLVGWIWGNSSSLSLGSNNHAGFIVRVEPRLDLQLWFAGLQSKLVRFNDEPRGNLLWSPVMFTPKSTASHQTSHMCRFRGGSRRGLPVRQAEYISIEALGCNCRGPATVPYRFAPSLLLSFIIKFASFFQLTSLLLNMVQLLCLSWAMYWGIQFP
ncbi:Os04g0478000 [Oryza sativa Japonica Group]|jgi:hypothetical protein|uniref:Os04g0478000 protein n=2 Tax=Oryza sativa subsp. japonica TaxID=39947 RepID=A0A0P0WBX1_ORYSJ|nr:hypothetical protein DAI22_04g169800 [Oryza sativa Japonica Group]BAS89709.1 Os04g0478000 [Oryza sativa Japonica Group]